MDNDAILTALLTRRSVSPKRLIRPPPSREALDSMIGAALCAPDHGGLLPWRVIEFPNKARDDLAELFTAERLRRDPHATTEDLARAREHAVHSPTLLAFVVKPQANHLVPVSEQWLSAGAGLGSILSAAHLLGFGAIMLSGERCRDEQLRIALRLQTDEVLAGSISIGTIGNAPHPVTRRRVDEVCSSWNGASAASR